MAPHQGPIELENAGGMVPHPCVVSDIVHWRKPWANESLNDLHAFTERVNVVQSVATTAATRVELYFK